MRCWRCSCTLTATRPSLHSSPSSGAEAGGEDVILLCATLELPSSDRIVTLSTVEMEDSADVSVSADQLASCDGSVMLLLA